MLRGLLMAQSACEARTNLDQHVVGVHLIRALHVAEVQPKRNLHVDEVHTTTTGSPQGQDARR